MRPAARLRSLALAGALAFTPAAHAAEPPAERTSRATQREGATEPHERPADSSSGLADEILQRLDAVEGGEVRSPRRQVVLSAILALATWVGEDLTCIAGGLLVARGQLFYWVAVLACFIGIFVGDMLLVFAGRLLGPGAVRRWPLSRLISPQQLERSERWFRERGGRVIFVSRFVPGSRLPLFLAAGVLRAPLLPIAGALLVAGAIWTPMLVGLSAWTGGAVLGWLERYEKLALVAVGVAVLASWIALRLVVPLFSWRGRRLLLSRWRRLSRWEFWPAWLFQAPVFLHVLRLGWKHGGIGTFASANPGIPAGGFVEESKSAILAALGNAPVARFLPFSPAAGVDAREAARAAMLRGDLEFPVVVKPDVGERGFGVAVVRNDEDLDRALAGSRGDWIVQEYVAGEEFGVFYARPAGETTGRLISITAKRFPVVVGDGARTIENLILADDRAVCMAPYYLEANANRLDDVPRAGEPIQLVEIGNHCRGTVFLDGREHATPELLAAIERIVTNFPGFAFGRFDLRAPDVTALRQGRDLRILELNGVTSEATHIYAPGASLLAGWRTLFAQWRLAFEIGAANIAKGERRHSFAELVSLLRERRRRFATIAAATLPRKR